MKEKHCFRPINYAVRFEIECAAEAIRKGKELRGRDCVYGGIPFHGCAHFQERLAEARKTLGKYSRLSNSWDERVEARLASRTIRLEAIVTVAREEIERIRGERDALRETLRKFAHL